MAGRSRSPIIVGIFVCDRFMHGSVKRERQHPHTKTAANVERTQRRRPHQRESPVSVRCHRVRDQREHARLAEVAELAKVFYRTQDMRRTRRQTTDGNTQRYVEGGGRRIRNRAAMLGARKTKASSRNAGRVVAVMGAMPRLKAASVST